MKGNLIILGFIVCISSSCFADPVPWKPCGIPSDTVKKLYNIDINGNPVIKGLRRVDAFDIYKKTCYLTVKDKLVELDIPTGKWSVNSAVSPFINKLRKENRSANKIIVRNDTYYLSVLNDLYKISSNGEAVRIAHTYSFILSFNVMEGSNLLVATRDSLLLMDNNGKLLSVKSFHMSDGSGCKMTSRGICYSDSPELPVYEFQTNHLDSITAKEYAPISSAKTIEEPYLSCLTEGYLLCFAYKKRDAIYILSKDDMKHALYRKVQIKGSGFSPNAAQLQEEEGEPDFKITYEDHTAYILAISRGKLRILNFKL